MVFIHYFPYLQKITPNPHEIRRLIKWLYGFGIKLSAIHQFKVLLSIFGKESRNLMMQSRITKPTIETMIKTVILGK